MEISPVSVLLNEHDVPIKLHSEYAGLHQWIHIVFSTGQRSFPSSVTAEIRVRGMRISDY